MHNNLDGERALGKNRKTVQEREKGASGWEFGRVYYFKQHDQQDCH